MLARLFLFFLFVSPAFAGVENASTWVMPLRSEAHFGLNPFERTAPILLTKILYTADQTGRVLAIDRKKGYILWETKLEHGISGALAYGRSKLFVGDLHGNLIALNARDGSESWRFKSSSPWLSAPVVSKTHNQVFVSNASGDLYALSDNHGEVLWRYARHPVDKMTVWGSGGPALFGDTEVYQGFSDGTLVALQADSGKVIWEKKLRTRERFGDIDMTPYVDEQRVVASSFDGQVFCLDRLTGNTKWVFPVGSYSGFLVHDGQVFFGGLNQHFYALDLATGHTVWKTPFAGGVSATPILLRGSLVFPTSSDPVYLLNLKDGKIQTTVSLGAGAFATPVASEEDGWWYALSNYGNLYSFELRQTIP